MSGTSTRAKPELRIAWCGRDAAHFACTRWHYSRSLPASKSVFLGVWEGQAFIGCVIFGYGANRNLAQAYGLTQTACCELTRVALRSHVTPVSRIIAISLRMLRAHCPGLRLIVSYADPAEGHHGGIYQAGGWIYDGTLDNSNGVAYFDVTGQKLHKRQLSARGVMRINGQVRRVPRFSECRKERIPAKHRYLMPLDRDMHAQLLRRARPYPKAAVVSPGCSHDQS